MDSTISIDYGKKYIPNRDVKIIKKDGTLEDFNVQKVIDAVGKSAYRALTKFTEEEKETICKYVVDRVNELEDDHIPVPTMHNIVEGALELTKPIVAKSYRDYRNYKQDFVRMMDDVYKKSQSIMYIGDKENSNTDSALVSTKRSLIFNQFNKELYQKFFMTTEEIQACRDGYIYVHDMSARRDTMNCFRRDTRFITKDGIKSFYDFSDGDTTMVLSHKGIWRRAIVRCYGWQPIQKVTFTKGQHTSIPKEVYCTANHRWIKRDGSETTNLSVGDILWAVPDITEFDWNSLSLEDKKMWCKGFAKGDGSLIGTRGKNILIPRYMVVRLCGHKVEYAYRFIECGYSVCPIKDSNDLLVHMLDNTSKEIPWLSLNYNNLLYYINGLMCADGELRKPGSLSKFRGIQVTGDFNNDIYDLLNIAGYYVTSMRNLTGQETNYGIRESTTIHYNICSTQQGISSWRVSKIEKANLNPKAEVWCLEVEEDHSFLLEGGIPTGNCCLADIKSILTGGFEMGNIWYNEPKSLDVAFDVIGDIVLSAASQQYGK